MITDMTDLEPAIDQYDSATILVGPLRSLSINSTFRYFYIAGNGTKVYNTLGLGFIDSEFDAARQRTDIIEKLKARFSEVATFDDHTEMARAVNARWSNEETTRFLGAVEFTAWAEQEKSTGDEEFTDSGAKRPTDEQPLATESYEVFAPGQPDGNLPRRASSPWPTAEFFAIEQHLRFALAPSEVTATTESIVTNAAARESIKPGSDDSLQTKHQFASPHAAEIFDDHSDETSAKRVALVDEPASTRRLTDLLAAIAATSKEMPTTFIGRDRPDGSPGDDLHSPISRLRAASQSDSAEIEPYGLAVPPGWGASGLTSMLLQITASAAALALVLALVLPLVWQHSAKPVPGVTDAAPSISNTVSGARQSVAAGPAASPNRVVAAETPVPQEQISTTPAATSPPVASPPAAASAGAAPQAAITQRPAEQPDTPAVAILVARGVQSLQRGDPQAAEHSPQGTDVSSPMGSLPVGASTDRPAGIPGSTPARAAAATRGPHQTGASQATKMVRPPLKPGARDQATPQIEALPVTAPASAQSQPTQLASVEPTTGSISPEATTPDVQPLPQLDPGAIAALLKRGIDYLNSGDIASARLTLQRAAEAGNAEAALALGSTYDPLVLRKLGAIGIASDMARARQWYQKAEGLGSRAAVRQLARLAQPGR